MSSRLYEDIKIEEGIIPSSITADKGGKDIDIRHINDSVIVLNVGAVTGTSPELDVSIQECDEISYIDRTTIDTSPTWEVLRKATGSANIKLNVYTFGTISDIRSVKSVLLYLKRVGTIASGKSVYLTIEADSSGNPSGTPKGTSRYVSATNMSTTPDWIEFVFDEPVDLASTDHIVIQGDYTQSDSNYIAVPTNAVTSGGDFMHYSGAEPSWTGVATKQVPIMIYYYVWEIPEIAFDTISESGLYELNLDLSNRKRYIRAYFEVSGSSPDFTCDLIYILGKGVYNPL